MLKKLMLTIAFATFCLTTHSTVKAFEEENETNQKPVPTIPAKKTIQKDSWYQMTPLNKKTEYWYWLKKVNKYPDDYKIEGNTLWAKNN